MFRATRHTRLLKYVKAHSGLFTARQIASIWKRSSFDVEVGAADLAVYGLITIDKKGNLHA
jgi:hypothetical protein